jgi:hypothetical protein
MQGKATSERLHSRSSAKQGLDFSWSEPWKKGRERGTRARHFKTPIFMNPVL